MQKKVDFLIMGCGIAGLTYALKASEHGKVIMLSKTQADECATSYAQGGIAAVMYEPDTYEKHIKDTLKAGDDLNDENIVRITISESTDRIKELIDWGTEFDKEKSGRYDLAREGGHSEYRVLHHKDNTGFEIQQSLLKKAKQNKNIEFLENHFALEILTQHHLGKEITRRSTDIECFGAYVMNEKTGNIFTILSKITMICSGGSGNVYNSTSNPPTLTGDGIAMVYRAKGEIEKMEFVQFHPTVLYNPREKPAFLITEALRGSGAILKNIHKEEFMHKYDERKSLAPRDIVARAIDTEMKQHGSEHVYLDATKIPKEKLCNHFPNIYNKCLSIGYDISKEMIPVVPSAHYLCGGIKVDEWGRTSIKHLYASGECASTGLHGANRLASNSLLEAMVFSNRAYLNSHQRINAIDFCENIPDWDSEGTVLNEEMVLITQTKNELQSIMSNYVGIVRSNLRLERALKRLKILYEETETLYKKSVLNVKICELRNLISIAFLITRSAQNRKESRGLHFSIDYPPKK